MPLPDRPFRPDEHAAWLARKLAWDAEWAAKHPNTTTRGTTMSDAPETTLTDGSPVTPDHREINPDTGMQRGYVVLSEAERAKGFVRPVRQSYVHERCGTKTTMGLALAETYARDPQFYSATFCCSCCAHFPVGPDGEFTWHNTNEKVGT